LPILRGVVVRAFTLSVPSVSSVALLQVFPMGTLRFAHPTPGRALLLLSTAGGIR